MYLYKLKYFTIQKSHFMKKALISGLLITAFFAVSGIASNNTQQVNQLTTITNGDIPSYWVLIDKWTTNGIVYKKYWTTVEFIIINDEIM